MTRDRMDELIPSADGAPIDHSGSLLRAPFRTFWRWWSFWTLFPLAILLPHTIVDAAGGFLISLIWIPLFFWCGLPTMRLWLQRPRPAWLFFVLWMAVPLTLFLIVTTALRLVGLLDPCCSDRGRTLIQVRATAGVESGATRFPPSGPSHQESRPLALLRRQ